MFIPPSSAQGKQNTTTPAYGFWYLCSEVAAVGMMGANICQAQKIKYHIKHLSKAWERATLVGVYSDQFAR